MIRSLCQGIPFGRWVSKRLLLKVVLAGLLAGLVGCSTPPPSGRIESANNQGDVKLRPGFKISMSVLVAGNKEIDEPAKRVMDSGTLTLPLLGTIVVADLSLEELQTKLVGLYAEYFVQPQVILDFVRDGDNLDISPWGFVTVLGRVKEPGRVGIPATRDLTVSGAIQMTGGLAPSAKDSAILVTRSLANGETKTVTVNLRSVGVAGRVEEDIILEANDVVFVPELMF